MENFVNRKIDGEQLCDGILGLRRMLQNKVSQFTLDLISNSEKIQIYLFT